MTKKLFYPIILLAFAFVADAQTTSTPAVGGSKRGAAADPFEVGVGAGLFIAQGDLEYKPSFGVSVHGRKALDAIFSLRAEAFAGQLRFATPNNTPYRYGGTETRNDGGVGDDRFINKASSSLLSGELQLVVNLTSVRFDGRKRRLTPYVFGGAGIGHSNTKVDVVAPSPRDIGTNKALEISGRLPGKIVGLFGAGGGIAVKFTDRVFLGLEGKVTQIFGKRSDLLDGFAFNKNDIPFYGSARLNYIIGNGLPSFYASPFDQIQADVAELKARPKFDPTDTDADGIIDMFDQEKSTPAGYAVDTRGVTLDSDADGYPNSKDKEPFSQPGYKVNGDGVAQMPKPNFTTEADVNRIIDAKLADLKATLKPQAIVDWFLPMINFDFNKSNIRSSEYEKLAYVGNVMQRNPSIRVAVAGFTDAVSSQGYNDNLSYNRSEAAINYLMTKYGISRDRFVLDYNGETTMLVDTQAKNYINRRVEFRVAQAGETDKGRPSAGSTIETMPAKKSPKFKGNKEAGY